MTWPFLAADALVDEVTGLAMACLSGEEVNERAEKKNFVWGGDRAERCPFKALPVFEGHAYHCDLCGGKPRCVEVCTPGALTVSK